MEDLTGIEVHERYEALESGAALLLGRMQFEFARLDVAVGLCAVWVDGGMNLKAHTPVVEAMSLKDKLKFVEEAVEKKFAKGSGEYIAYRRWLAEAHVMRMKRNELVHGRWGISAATNEVVCVVGLPTSNMQREIRYGLADLEAIQEHARRLQNDLYRLREKSRL